MPAIIPPLGCAAVPLPKKTLTIDSKPPSALTAAERGVVVTAAAVVVVAAAFGDDTDVSVVATLSGPESRCVAAVFLDDFDSGLELRAEPAFFDGFVVPELAEGFAGPAVDELDFDEPVPVPAEPVSADATAGFDAIAKPTPRAITDAPVQQIRPE